MVKPLEENYIYSLRAWANGVIEGDVITTQQSAARVALELLDHIQFLKDAIATERYIRTTGMHTLPQTPASG